MENRGVQSVMVKPVVVACDMITPFGKGVDACWEGIMGGKTAIAPVTRFKTSAFQSEIAGIVPDLVYHGNESLVMQMLRPLLAGSDGVIPRDAALILATTKGEIDLLETKMLEGRGAVSEAGLDRLLPKVEKLCGAEGGSMLISAACTSSSAAVARASALIREGRHESVLVVACDSVTEFIYSGFSSLMALDKAPARPFDRNRAGLSVGEAAAYALVMSRERAEREKRPFLGTIEGWGLTGDANHMTGPSRTSAGLILAIRKAFRSADISGDKIGFISAHGTGTLYNDEMEMRAFRTVFSEQVSLSSLKGGIGHTMGAAGLVELIMALRAFHQRRVLPVVNLVEPDRDAAGWVSDSARALGTKNFALMTNTGFSGINTALVLGSAEVA